MKLRTTLALLIAIGAVSGTRISLTKTNCSDYIPSATINLLLPSCILVDFPGNNGTGDLLLIRHNKGAIGEDRKTKVTIEPGNDDEITVTLRNSDTGVEQQVDNVEYGKAFEVNDDVLTDDVAEMTLEKAREFYDWTGFNVQDRSLKLSFRQTVRNPIDPRCADKWIIHVFCIYRIGLDADNFCNRNDVINNLCKHSCSKYTRICADTRWGYTGFLGQDNWATNLNRSNNVCNGTMQSPIDLANPNITNTVTNLTTPLNITSAYTTQTLSGSFTNNGHTVQLDATNAGDYKTTFNGSTFNLLQIHFHWGPNDASGSEHTENGTMYPLEMHIVHLNDAKTAALVLGFFFEVSSTDFAALTPLFSKLGDLKLSKSKVSISGFDLKPFIDRVKLTDFYNYPGSLTTPVCSEIVTWIVFADKLPVSSNQLAPLRLPLDVFGDPQITNFRRVQPLNDRTLTRYKS